MLLCVANDLEQLCLKEHHESRSPASPRPPQPFFVAVHPPPSKEAVTNFWASGHRKAGLELVDLTLRSAIKPSISVAHVHWPEHLIRAERLAAAKAVWAWTLLLIVILRRLPLVLTLHNLQPHGGPRGAIERRFIALLKRHASAVVTLVPEHEELVAADRDFRQPRVRTIPLGALSRSNGHDRPDFRDGPLRLFHLGVIAPYKGQQRVAQGLSLHLERGEVCLLVAGRADDEYLAGLRHQTAHLPNVTIKSGWIADSDLETYLSNADAVIGYQDAGLNTGTIYSSVPAGIPVVCSPTTQARSESARLGEDWVLIIDDVGETTAWEPVLKKLHELRMQPAPPPAVDFGWETSGRAHAKLYSQLLSHRDGRLSRDPT